MGLLVEADTCYRRALEIKSDYHNARSNTLFLLNYSSSNNPAYCFTEASQYGQVVSNKVTKQFAEWAYKKPFERLRIGFVSCDFKNHPVGYFIENLLSHLDHNAIEIFAYPTHPYTDDLTARIKPYFSAWKPLHGKTDEAAAHLIHNDCIQILIDISGHTAGNRLPMFAWKPAPVQVSWLGYCATTGLEAIDYYIADPWALPETEEKYFTEKIWRLPETYLCFTPPNLSVEISPLPALKNGYITFGSFNNLTKINEDVIALWSRVLLAVPDSRLFLKTKQLLEPSVSLNIIKSFAAYGIDSKRLILEGNISSRFDHLATYQRVDICLDPFPYSGITTSIESLWMGVPVLTLAGERFLARQGVSILKNAGIAEWIATDRDDYVARALTHTANLQHLTILRNRLRQQVLASPLFDATQFARNFEVALRGMWQAVCNIQHQQDD